MMKSNLIQNVTIITCKEERVKIKSNSLPEKFVDHLHVEEGEYQFQHSPEHHDNKGRLRSLWMNFPQKRQSSVQVTFTFLILEGLCKIDYFPTFKIFP